MSYSNNYNYQVAVIFAILLGGMLLLALVVGGIYFVCVTSMRDNEKKRFHSGRNSSAAWPTQAPSYTAPYREGNNTNTAILSSPTPVQNYEFAPPRPSVTQSTTAPQQLVSQQQYSSQMPLVTPTRIDNFAITAQYRPLQPDVIYTQGPSVYTQSTPVEYTVRSSLPMYHQSSV